MKFSIIVVIATLVFAFAAHFLLQDPGYVAINFRGYLVEMSVPVLLGIAIVLVVAVWAIRKLIIAPRMIGEAAGRYRAGRAGQKMMRGMIEVAEGNFARGEKLLARAASTSDAPLFNYLQAARAAHLQGNDQRRLRRIEENSRDHSYALGLLGKLYYQLEDWDNLGHLLPRLKTQGRITADSIRKWTVRVHREHLDRAQDGDVLQAAWKNVPRNLRNDLELLVAYFSTLIRIGSHEQAEKELPSALWGKARSYLETVISLRPTPEAYQDYGRLLNRLGEGDAAADAFRDGLGLVAESPKTAIPHLKTVR
jgi:HemY protein